MKSKILSLSVGGPETMEWEGKSVVSSMRKSPVEMLNVHLYSIDGDSFANPKAHGTPDSVLYIYGLKSVLGYMRTLGRDKYEPGSLGENILVDDLDEKLVSVGDVFQIGEVVAQATFPRIPCTKVNLRMQHAGGQQCMRNTGRSGIYLRILEPGKIYPRDTVERIEQAKMPYSIFDVYAKVANGIKLTDDERRVAVSNGAFPVEIMEKWRALIE